MSLESLFSDNIVSHIKKIETKHNDPKIQPIQDGEVKRRTEFEQEVFRYFYYHKEEQGIDAIYPFINMYVDGALKLKNRKAITLEIKHSLNWFKACNARVEIQRLQKYPKQWNFFTEKVSKKLDGALVVFKEFNADWRRKRQNDKWEDGWYFYEEEAAIGIPTIPIIIAQLTQERLEFGILTEITKSPIVDPSAKKL
jgi:hypothetical protein